MPRFEFPKDFLWGAATAAYQVEGAIHEDGRGDSVWDSFCRVPGNIQDASSGERACDHYHRLDEDLALMSGLGLKSYRFSIAWPRVQPTGRGPANPKGFDFYDRLVDGLLQRGIVPNATLFHWDLPQPLEDAGGWPERDTALRFAEYAALAAKRLGDRIGIWATFNEPQVTAFMSYEQGLFAPGRRESPQVVRQVIHHILLGHGLAIQALRAHAKADAKLGIVLVPSLIWPDKETPLHHAAAEAAWVEENDWWLLPLTRGAYPGVPLRRMEARGEAPNVQAGDLAIAAEPIDYLGVNGYFPTRVEADPSSERGYSRLPFSSRNEPLTDIGWEVYAPAFRAMLLRCHRYGKPLYVTENGISIADGALQDPRRVDFMRKHLAAVAQARAAGADIRAYYHWSLMDNFEWIQGYTQRFGLVHVDYNSFKRTPKDSYHWYRDTIAAGGFKAEVPEVLSGWETMGGGKGA